jgi:hypothetical protein
MSQISGKRSFSLARFVPESLAQAVERPELHRLVARLGRDGSEAVILQVAVAVLVQKVAAFAAAGLGEQKACARHAGRVVLHEFHVAKRDAVPVGERHAVACHDAAVGVLTEDPARAAGREDHGAGSDGGELTGRGRQNGRALHAPVVDEQVDAEIFVEPFDRGIFRRSLEQRVQDMEAAAVGCEPGPLDFHAAERADIDVAVGLAVPRAAPVLELNHLRRAAADEKFDHILLAQPVAAVNGVVEVVVERVILTDHARRAALRGNRVAAHRQDFRNECDGERGIRLSGRDGRAQTGAARSDYQDICIEMVHRAGPLWISPEGLEPHPQGQRKCRSNITASREKSVRAGSRLLINGTRARCHGTK